MGTQVSTEKMNRSVGSAPGASPGRYIKPQKQGTCATHAGSGRAATSQFGLRVIKRITPVNPSQTKSNQKVFAPRHVIRMITLIKVNPG